MRRWPKCSAVFTVMHCICIFCREPSGRNMRHMLASVMLRLLGNRVVYEDADLSFSPVQSSQSKMEVESPLETVSADLSGESLFDRLLLVLHGLLSNSQPSWLKPRSPSKLMSDFSKDSAGLDREVVESLQVRSLIKAPLPLARMTTNAPGKSKPLPLQPENDMEIDPGLFWKMAQIRSIFEHSAVIGSGDHSNLRASSWLKGTVRVRRTDLTYIGAVDDDS
ncbi:hypothetical protein GH714_038778 [Hevea brasiliensis]|uniref:Uncharacterized protein n=1 Tax=Hevea brasiliensis TaxID=3981 RepID=A0A6A6MRW4_HEVBR|nr:hypothetical protein GH714_038778 [Hevea brasiliensis]